MTKAVMSQPAAKLAASVTGHGRRKLSYRGFAHHHHDYPCEEIRVNNPLRASVKLSPTVKTSLASR